MGHVKACSVLDFEGIIVVFVDVDACVSALGALDPEEEGFGPVLGLEGHHLLQVRHVFLVFPFHFQDEGGDLGSNVIVVKEFLVLLLYFKLHVFIHD